MAVNEATLVILEMLWRMLSRNSLRNQILLPRRTLASSFGQPLPSTLAEGRDQVDKGFLSAYLLEEAKTKEAKTKEDVGYITKWVSKLLSTHRGEAADNEEDVEYIRKWVQDNIDNIRLGCSVEPLEIPHVSKSSPMRYDMKSLKEMYIEAAEKDITQWVDDYIKNIHLKSSSVRWYLLRIQSDKESLEDIMKSDSFLNGFTASKIFHERVREQYGKLFIQLLGRSVEFKHNVKREFKKPIISTESGETTDVNPTTLQRLEILWEILSRNPGSPQKVDADNYKEEDVKDVKYIKKWIDAYIGEIEDTSSSMYMYLLRIEGALDKLKMFMDVYRHLEGFAAFRILYNRLNQLYGMFFTELRGRLDELETLQGAKYLYDSLDDDLSRTRDFDRVIGALTMSNKEIGVGSDGTIVFEGYYHRRPVAVKRLLKTHHNVAVKEIYHLIESKGHANIVGYFGMESDQDFVYICLERCGYSLYDLISKNLDRENGLELWWNGSPSTLLQKLMSDIVCGVAHMHRMGIIHRDLKPQNVLVIIPKYTKVTAKISDMGISKKLKEDATSLTKHATGRGSSGWQPPEVLCNGSQSENVDLFSLGCILFFCITRGKHPFGEDFERDGNIVNDNKDLSSIENFPEAFDLISRLLNSHPKLRPKAQDVIHHVFFWLPKTLETFLHDISSDLEPKGQNPQLLKKLEGVLGGEKWTGKIDQQFLGERNRYRQIHYRGCPPYNDSVQDLLRLIRNSLEHYNKFLPRCQSILGGSCPEGVLAYFRSKFPKLFVGVHKVIWDHCAEDERLQGDNAKWKWKWIQKFDGP